MYCDLFSVYPVSQRVNVNYLFVSSTLRIRVTVTALMCNNWVAVICVHDC